MYIWKRSQQNLITFVLVDVAGNEVPGLGGTFTLAVSKAGAAFNPSAGTKGEIGSGWYKYLSTAAEANTVGPVAIKVTDALIKQQNLEYIVESRVVNAIEFTYIVTNIITGLPIPGVNVWFATDVTGLDIVWAGYTDTFGAARDLDGHLPFLDPGTYFVFREHTSFSFANPDSEVVS
jgi:hypothetical protein